MDAFVRFCDAASLHAELLTGGRDTRRPVDILHVVNPARCAPDHPLSQAQTITFEAMRRAAFFARHADASVSIRLAATVPPDDSPAAPPDFERLPDLDRVSADIGDFSAPRRLPLVFDIVDRARSAAAGPETVVIYTNVDIAPMPHFYTYAAWLIRRGIDVAVLNRRSVADVYARVVDYPAAAASFGEPHPGFDCFVMTRAVLDRLPAFDSIVGMGFAMRALLYGLAAHSERLAVVRDAHATFHIGDDQEWADPLYADYQAHNRRAWLDALAILDASEQARARLIAMARGTTDVFALPRGVLGLRGRDRRRPLRNRVVGRARRVLRRLLVET